MRHLLRPARRPSRAVEASAAQVIATGAAGGGWGDPVDNEPGWRRLGGTRREMPEWTLEKARVYSVAGYRSNPMNKAIIDTYTAFCVGDSGVKLQVTNDEVARVAREFWRDPRNNMDGGQELGLRSNMLLGETCRRVVVGSVAGVVRYAPMDPQVISEVIDKDGNPAWPEKLKFGPDGAVDELTVVQFDDLTQLRAGEVMWWTPYKTVETDQRSQPFLSSVLDWLDSYDTVLSNLIDRTALARYLVWDVTVEGDQTDVDNFVKARGGLHVPRSGSVEVHNDKVTWAAKTAETGAYEDSTAAKSVLTLAAAGSGLAKTWLAEPEDANRATSLTMAEPVRRRVQAVQKMWLHYQAEMVRFAVDQAVRKKVLPAKVKATDPRTGDVTDVPAWETVTVTGPEIAAADAQITAQTLLNLATGLEKLVQAKVLTREAAQVAARKAWEDYMGIPYQADLGKPDANPDDIAEEVEKAPSPAKLRAVMGVQGS